MRAGIGEDVPLRQLAAVGVTALGCVVVGGLAITIPGLGVVGALMTLAAAVAVGGASPLLLIVFPALFVSSRVGPGALNMSVADVALVAAALVALPLVPWKNEHVRRVAWAMGAYLAILFITVVASPSARALFEWAHRASFLFGGLSVGAAVAHMGQVRQAMRSLVVGATVVAVAAVLQSAGSGLKPAYPFGIQKNYAGALLAMTLVVLFVAPALLGLTRRTMLVLRCVLLLGTFATQSRGAAAGLFVALALWSVILEGRALRAIVILPALGLLVVAIVLSVQVDNERSTSVFTPVNSRRVSYDAALKEYRRDPIFGVGLRYYKAPGYRFDVVGYRDSYVEPHSVWFSTLGESGIVGVGALALLLALTLRAMRQIAGPLALAAALTVIAKLTHGMVDIYWVAGTQTLPWLLVGMAAARGRPSTDDQQAEAEGADRVAFARS